MIASFIIYCNAINSASIIVIAYIKFYRENRALKVNNEKESEYEGAK